MSLDPLTRILIPIACAVLAFGIYEGLRHCEPQTVAFEGTPKMIRGSWSPSEGSHKPIELYGGESRLDAMNAFNKVYTIYEGGSCESFNNHPWTCDMPGNVTLWFDSKDRLVKWEIPVGSTVTVK